LSPLKSSEKTSFLPVEGSAAKAAETKQRKANERIAVTCKP
jgi:hypothetical protein